MSRDLPGPAGDAASMANARDHCGIVLAASTRDSWIARDVGIMWQLQRILEVTRKYLQIQRATNEDRSHEH